MQVEIRQKDHTLIAGLAGDWALENAPPRFDRLVEERPPGRTVHAVGFDTMELGAWDSSLLTFLLQGMNYCEAQDLAFELDDKALAFQGFKSGLGRFFCGVECYRRETGPWIITDLFTNSSPRSEGAGVEISEDVSGRAWGSSGEA